MAKKIFVPVEVSARHIHLSQSDLDILFGQGYGLKKIKQLTQPSDFAAKETVDIQASEGQLNLRVVGPIRKETQIEISLTDALNLGLEAPVKLSGNIEGSCGAFLIGPKGKVDLKKGVIIAVRHLHCHTKEAEKLSLKQGQTVSIEIAGKRGLIFNNIKVRVGEGYKLCFHIDTDEGNAAGIDRRAKGVLIK